MAKILDLNKDGTNRPPPRSSAKAAQQTSVLLHSIVNQLTVIHMGCAKLEKELGRESRGKENTDLRMIAAAAVKIGSHLNALRFCWEKPGRFAGEASSVQRRRNLGPLSVRRTNGPGGNE